MHLEREFGFREERTAYGQSLCLDEVSTRRGGLWEQMVQLWGGNVFPLGGIGGVPFVGKSGFKAFLSQGLKGGDAVVLFGPHVGITPNGEVGKYIRVGQKEPVPACRAWVAAFEDCLVKGQNDDLSTTDPLDMQQSWLRRQLAPHVDEIAQAKSPMAALAYQSYDIVAQKFYSILDAQFDVGRLALIGGIQISMPGGYEDHFLPIDFEVLQVGEEPQDCLDTFNKWS